MFCKIPDRAHIALFILRITLGIIFIAHGSQKVFGLFGGPGLEGFAQWAASMGISSMLAYLGAFAELTGGLLLLLGIATELGALLVISVMLAAIYFVHWPHGFFGQNNGFEYPLFLIVSALAIIIGGPGKWYLWRPCRSRGCKCTE